MDHPEIYKGLEKYITSLSDDEREKYKALIDEAIQRNRIAAQNFIEAKKNAEELEESMRRMRNTAHDLHSGISRMNVVLSDVRDTSKLASDISSCNSICLN